MSSFFEQSLPEGESFFSLKVECFPEIKIHHYDESEIAATVNDYDKIDDDNVKPEHGVAMTTDTKFFHGDDDADDDYIDNNDENDDDHGNVRPKREVTMTTDIKFVHGRR